MSAIEPELAAPDHASARPWLRAVAWLLFLGPFFFLTYGFANHLAAQRAPVGSIVFDWEYAIPFLAWTIVPYWIIDGLYGISLFLCRTKQELDTHGKRLLTAQILAVASFILFPLRFTFERPATEGLSGWMFDVLSSFDQPYNQAPSLHIALLIVLWVLYARHLPTWLRWPFHVLAVLIGMSVLTTYQHHFIDIPTGLLLGWFCIWLWPDDAPAPLTQAALTPDPQRRRLGIYYLLGALGVAIPSVWMGGAALWLIWISISLSFVASFYLFIGSGGFQKRADGSMSVAAQWLLAPYLLGAWLNSRWWTRRMNRADPIVGGVFLGRTPSAADVRVAGYGAVVDLAAEMISPSPPVRWHALPSLDLVVPDTLTLNAAADAIEHYRQNGSVLVSCALGFSRSAAAVAVWLMRSQHARTAADAAAVIRRARPAIVLSARDLAYIDAVAQGADAPEARHDPSR